MNKDNVYFLPHSSDNAARLVYQLMNDKKIKQVVSLLENSYEEEPTLEIFIELMELYLMFDETMKIRQLWSSQSMTQTIMASNELIALYAKTAHHLVIDDSLIANLYRLRDSATDDETIQSVNQAIQLINEYLKVRQQIITMHPIELDKLLNEKKIDSLIEALIHLEIQDALPVIRTILEEPDISNYSKYFLFTYLIERDVNDTVSFSWFNEAHEEHIKPLQPLKNMPHYLLGLEQIQQYLSQDNPHMYQYFIEIYHHLAMLFYPYVHRLTPLLPHFMVQLGMDSLPLDSSDLTEPVIFNKAFNELITIIFDKHL